MPDLRQRLDLNYSCIMIPFILIFTMWNTDVMNFYLDRRVVIKNCLNDQKHRKTRHCFKRHKVRADVITQPLA